MQRLAFGVAELGYDDYIQMSLREVWNAAKPKLDKIKSDRKLQAHYMTFVINPLRLQLDPHNTLLKWEDLYPFDTEDDDEHETEQFSEEWKKSLAEKHKKLAKRREEIFGKN